MDTRPSPPFVHTPYDGTSQPFTVGLKPITEETFLEPDRYLDPYLHEKARLLAENRETVFRAEPETEAAQAEVLKTILGNLSLYHRDTHRIGPDSVGIPEAGLDISLEGEPPLLAASRLVQEDLVLMRPGPDGYRLVAASLCFPSSWSLEEKFGQSMTGIHENVPGFNGARMGNMVARLFENLKPDQLLCRYNWSLYDDPDLHHPRPKRIRAEINLGGLAQVFIRVERQTLRRLPGSGDILFTIKVHHDPIAELEKHEDRARLASGLRQQLLALDTDQMAYKGVTLLRDHLAVALERLAAAAE